MAMLKAFTLITLAWALPVILLLALNRRLKRADFFTGLALNIAYQSLLAGYLHLKLPFGAFKLGLIVLGAFVLTHLSLRGFSARDRVPKKIWWIGLAALSTFTFFDLFVVLARQGWEPLLGTGPYFRAPFNNDGERNVILIEALLRGTANPFLPHTKLTYQLLWHHAVAPMVALFPGPERFAAVCGAVLASGVTGFSILLWALSQVSPRFFLRPAGWILAAVFLFNADLYHFLESLWVLGKPGIEADWSIPPLFIHYFPLKLTGLLSSQHLFFLVWLSMYLAIRTSLRFFFFGLCWIASPPLFIFFFPFYFLANRVQIPRHALVFVIACLIHTLALGFAPWLLFTRQGVQRPQLWDAAGWTWPLLPFAGFLVVGLLGLVIAITGAALWKQRKLSLAKGWEGAIFFLAIPLSHYVYTMQELRRHFALLAFFAALFWIIRYFPRLTPRLKSRVALSCLVVGAALHGYFLYCFLGKPNQIDVSIPWKDYLAMKETIRNRFPGLSTLAAVHPTALGTICPPIMETTTSFASPLSASVHTILTNDKIAPLKKIILAGDAAPYGKRLGYRAILWGPAEEKVWGEKTRARFIHAKAELAREGSVGLYWLHDSWEPWIEKEKKKGGDAAYRIAHRFAVESWRAEAVEYFHEALRDEPRHRPAWLELARVVEAMGQSQWRKEILSDAVRMVPNFREARDLLNTIDQG